MNSQPLLERLQRQLKQSRQRLLVWVQGEQAWCHRQLETALSPLCSGQGVLLGQPLTAAAHAIPSLKAAELHRVLGTTLDFAVVDAYAGFNPNAFGQLCGTVRGGGVLLLLTPAADQWRGYDDPEYASLCVEPHTPADMKGHFLQYLCSILEGSDQLLCWSVAGATWPRLPQTADPEPAEQPCLSLDQAEAVKCVLAVAEQRRAALVLTADRGRGKSAALGIAAARLLQQGKRVILTAPSRAATSAVFERVQALAPDCMSQLLFASPDDLLHQPVQADLLLVDEAAAIPTPVLVELLNCCPRIVFSTTLHGYEGNGQGFALRFRHHLELYRPTTAEYRLETPIRWAGPDPLEHLSNRMLLLDVDTQPLPSPDQSLLLETIDQAQLSQDPALLRDLFALLLLAHYRTTPGDLRILLDSPNLQIHVLMQQGQPLACVLVAEEGELPDALAQTVWEGRRRPRGHLLPQTLIAQEGWGEVASWRAWRIMRIAVHPLLQQQGLGAQLLNELECMAVAAGVDYLGASFAASESLLAFWHHCGYRPVRLGEQRDPVAGTHALLVVRPVSDQVRQWLPRAQHWYGQSVLRRLPGALQDLEPERLTLLLGGLWQPDAADLDTLKRLRGFAQDQRTLESSLLPLSWLLEQTLPLWGQAGIGCDDQRLLCERILRQQPATAVAEPAGKRAQLQRLRNLCDQLLALLPSA
ncbi:tRNA(Met) cytidine acetyltransferase TmcA [Marinobacterium iners]|uniref:tRNA(Met) cytidine acetyltransferase TmcA n=1 Tax=Marinobacterium iners DSM 11526 TaxID=1122198 RepID=A0A1H4GFZ2_9GAMM|nr:GNAT family N-acetyltransferase [Marinobacterium iners]SEB08543.1 tRNA(Met)-cytidine N(4)-acetyltransferase [Marinobacterium iners DSM 11526]